jgi:hypothetical protein
MKNYWKPAVVIAVLVVAAVIVIPRLGQQTGGSTNNVGVKTTGGSSLPVIDKALHNGKPTLLLLRSST